MSRTSAAPKPTSAVYSNLSRKLQRPIDLAQEKGSSSWLEALPLSQHGFHLSKREFHDVVCLRYGWLPDHLPSNCVCGAAFTVKHALSCPSGGYPSLRHHEVQDLITELMSKVCTEVSTEPHLEPLSGRHFAVGQYQMTTRPG